MRATYKETKTAHVVLKSTNSRFGKNLTVDVFYMRERKIHATIEGLPSMHGKTWQFTSNGDEVQYDDLSGNVQSGDFDLDNIPMPVNLEVMSFWDWERQLSTASGGNMERSRFKLVKNESWNGKKWTVLEETAYAQDVFVRYFIEPSSSLIYRVLVYDLSKDSLRQETTVTKLDRNIKLSKRMFEIKDGDDGGLDEKRELKPPAAVRAFKKPVQPMPTTAPTPAVAPIPAPAPKIHGTSAG